MSGGHCQRMKTGQRGFCPHEEQRDKDIFMVPSASWSSVADASAGFGLLLVPLLLMQFYFYYQLFWQNGDSVLLLPGFLGLDRSWMKDEEE